MPDFDPDDYDSPAAYAIATAHAAVADVARPEFDWAIGGEDREEGRTEKEYAVEPRRGGSACAADSELAGPIEDLPDFADGARIIVREIHYGPWRYVTPEEIENA